MPFSVSDVSKYNNKLTTQSQKEQWVAIANNVLEDCTGNDCDAQAIKIANGVLAKQKMMPPNFRDANGKRKCVNCNYFNLEYCTLYDVTVKENDMCDMWMPVFNYTSKGIPQKYAHIDFKPPQYAIDAYKNGLDRHKNGETGDGLEAITVRMARQFAQGKPTTPEWARKGNRWWGRNKRFAKEEPGSPAYASAQLWGGKNWFAPIVKQMDTADKKD